MRVAFDLDGTLDRPAIADLARVLLAGGHEVHIITGVFSEAGDWQGAATKRKKLRRIGIPFHEDENMLGETIRVIDQFPQQGARLHILYAVDHEKYDRDYRLVDLGLRKGALCEQLGIDLVIDDSEMYCKYIPAMSGGTTVLHVR
jgi:hypothetical protein